MVVVEVGLHRCGPPSADPGRTMPIGTAVDLDLVSLGPRREMRSAFRLSDECWTLEFAFPCRRRYNHQLSPGLRKERLFVEPQT